MVYRWAFIYFVTALFALAVQAEPLTTTQIAEKALPACVSLEVTTADGVVTGSGVLVDESGVVLTCYHVIDGAKSAVIKMHNGGSFPIQGVLASSRTQDIALLKVLGRGLTTLPLGDSSVLKPGDKVVAIGDPHGLDHTVSEGIISAVRQVGDLPKGDLKRLLLDGGWSKEERLIQFTAPISNGNSGGPLINSTGEIIGINILREPSADNIYFAVPSAVVKPLLIEKPPSPLSTMQWDREVSRGDSLDTENANFGFGPLFTMECDFTIPRGQQPAFYPMMDHRIVPALVSVTPIPAKTRSKSKDPQPPPVPWARVEQEPNSGEFQVQQRGRWMIRFSPNNAKQKVHIVCSLQAPRVAILSTINESGLPAIKQAMQESLTKRFSDRGTQVIPVQECLPVIKAENLFCDSLVNYEAGNTAIPNLAKVCNRLNVRYAVASVCLQAFTEDHQYADKNYSGEYTIKSYTDIHATILLMGFDGKTGNMLFKRVKSGSRGNYVTDELIGQLFDEVIEELN